MPRLCPLFSGSDGNSYYIGSADSGILIDAGRSTRQIVNALTERGLDMKNVKAVFVTHEHIDHIKGLKVLADKYHIPVCASQGTMEELIAKEAVRAGTVLIPVAKQGMECAGMYIKPFGLSHDCREGTGYVVATSDGRKTAFVTDTGMVTEEIANAVKGCDTAVIESNHDIEMLQCGSYPYMLKRRILSDRGHLSNEVCAETVRELVGTGTTRMILAHLSRENNLPRLAEETTLSVLSRSGMKKNIDFQLYVAKAEDNGLTVLY